jgi:membrane-bound serine protease (ClpP class)
MLLAVVGIVVIALLSPRLHIFDALTLKTRITGTAGGPLTEPSLPEDFQPAETLPPAPGDYSSLVGKIGIAVTTLRPSGRVEIDGEVYPVEADGSFVDPGRGVKVTRVRGNTVTVRLV